MNHSADDVGDCGGGGGVGAAWFRAFFNAVTDAPSAGFDTGLRTAQCQLTATVIPPASRAADSGSCEGR